MHAIPPVLQMHSLYTKPLVSVCTNFKTIFAPTASHTDLKAIWCCVIWRVNYPSTVDQAVQRFLSAFELFSTLLD